MGPHTCIKGSPAQHFGSLSATRWTDQDANSVKINEVNHLHREQNKQASHSWPDYALNFREVLWQQTQLHWSLGQMAVGGWVVSHSVISKKEKKIYSTFIEWTLKQYSPTAMTSIEYHYVIIAVTHLSSDRLLSLKLSQDSPTPWTQHLYWPFCWKVTRMWSQSELLKKGTWFAPHVVARFTPGACIFG